MIRKLFFILIFIKPSGKQKSNSQKNAVFLVRYYTNTYLTKNDRSYEWNTIASFNSQDQEMLNILEELHPVEKVEIEFNSTLVLMYLVSCILKGIFLSEFVFNLKWRALTEAEISVLENGLDYAPI